MEKRKFEETVTPATQMCDRCPLRNRYKKARSAHLDREVEWYQDVALVVSHTACTENEAIEALIAREGNVVDAIMDITCRDF